MKRILSVILCVAMLVTCLAGCDVQDFLEKLTEQLQAPQIDVPSVTEPAESGGERHLIYSLDQEMIDEFYKCLENAQEISINGTELETIEGEIDKLDAAYSALADQYQIAYILYCADQSDEELSQRYLDTMDICTDAELAYNEMAKTVYLSDTPFRDELFADWTPEEIDMMLKHNDEIAALEKRNSEITVEYRDLPEETIATDMIPLYNELVSNNNRIAQLYGYDNYYEFAYKMVYQRDYDSQELNQMREYAAQYMPQVSEASLTEFYSVFYGLEEEDQYAFSDILWTDYTELEENYITDYLSDLGASTRDSMMDMFENDRVLFTNSPDAYEGAFTTFIGDEPFCYYGPGYMGCETIIHELGHYYGGKFSNSFNISMDLCETQSQSNEWLFIQYMKDRVSEDVYNAFAEYKLANESSNIIVFILVDAFEELAYTHENAGNLTAQEYDDLMAQAAEQFGGIEYVQDNIGDVQYYWKMVVVESPVYYISYAVSSIASINLFTIAQDDEEAARECYRKLIEEVDEQKGFLWHIQQAGLSGPFEETVYQDMLERYTN